MTASYDERKISLITAKAAEAIEQASLGHEPWTLPAQIFSAFPGGSVVFVRPPSLSDLPTLAQIYGLTGAELSPCVSLYADRVPQETAIELGIGYEAVRTRTKDIFAKAGTRGQPGLCASLTRYSR